MKTFEDLDCWKKTTVLRRTLSEMVKSFPQDEKFKLTDQIIRASRSVTANIAEGFGRFHYQEYVQYCRQSRGSLYEIVDHLIVANDEGYISQEELRKLKSEIEECLALLNGFINYLVKAKQTTIHEPSLYYEHSTDNENQPETS